MNHEKQNTLKFVLVLILVAAFSRIIPHPHNFTPVGGIAVFGSYFLGRKIWAFLVPLFSLWLSDLFINNIIEKKPLPVYGDGKYTRDWLFVKDHAVAIDLVFHEGKNHETYNIGGFNEWQNIDLVKLLCQKMDEKLGRTLGESEQLITYVKDRPGHDLRYAIDASKINRELGWKPSVTFEEGLAQTIDWYLDNEEWLKNVTSGDYQHYYNKQYS